MSSSQDSEKQLKLLVLHGYGQTTESMKRNTNISRAFRGHNLVYINAPHNVVNYKGEPGRSWWTYSDAPSIDCTSYNGIETSIELIKRESPFDGIIGFSQGGTFASILCGLFDVDMCVLIGAYPAKDPRWGVTEGKKST